MSKFSYDGETFDLLDEDSMLWAEAASIERMTGKTIRSEGDSAEITAGFVWASIKRVRPGFMKLSEFMQLPMGATQPVDEPEETPDPEDEVPDPLESSEPEPPAS
jgi:hypothetical protein